MVEGNLTKAWVEELKLCWQAAFNLRPQHTRIDLVDVNYIDEEGKNLLASMHEAGVEIAATGLLTRAIVDEVTQGASAAFDR